MPANTTTALDELVERLGLAVEEEGLPRIAGRIYALLIFEEGPFSLDDLVDRLNISKASASSSTRHLIDLGIIERVTKPRDRRDFFRLMQTRRNAFLEGLIERRLRFLRTIEQCLEELPPNRDVARERLEMLVRFQRVLQEGFEEIQRRWIKELEGL